MAYKNMCCYNAVSDPKLTFSCNKSVCKTFEPTDRAPIYDMCLGI